MSQEEMQFDLSNELPYVPKILVADDDWLNRDLLNAYLSDAGCEVVSFSEGASAWEAIKSSPPDLAILDIKMPGMDGLTLCKNIKLLRMNIPVVIVTALDEEEEKIRAINNGADDFIGKPYSSVILLTRVRSLLKARRLHLELEKRKQLLEQVLNRYVDASISDVMLKDPERYLKLGGESKDVTVLFADIRGYSPLTETLPPDQVVEMINLIFTQLTQEIFLNAGTLDKFIGDAVMALFGAPFSDPLAGKNAMKAALGMQKRFQELKEKYPSVQALAGIGIGVHCGDAIVGNIGSEQLMDYTAIGDAVNIAKRLQEIARPGEILISKGLFERFPETKVIFEKTRRLQGRIEEVFIYKLIEL
ncbi:MAG: response regulator [Anaerolineales bacterium]|nr:response regulator [Anaerolineales bacterium]